jgi:glycosyltransferase involved in cell wall biosynthesis
MLAHRSSGQPYFPVSCNVSWIDDDGRFTDWSGPVAQHAVLSKWRVVSRLRALGKSLTRNFGAVDVILANHSLTAFPVRWCRGKGKRFYYIQAYEPEYYAFEPGWSPRVLRRLSALSYRMRLHPIVNADIYRDYKGIRSQHVVPPGIDDAIFYPAGARTRRDSNEFVIGCIGRKEVWKGTRSVVDAFRLLRDLDQRYVLRVAYGNLPECCRDLPGIEIVVPKNDAELSDYYRSLDVMVAPGTVQLGAAHYPVIEALACGIPVVTTGYFPATRESAWIVPVDDPRSIADAVVEIAGRSDVVERRVSQGLDAVKSLSWPCVAASMLSIFQESTKAA